MKELQSTHVVQSSQEETKNALKESGMTRFCHAVGPLLRVLRNEFESRFSAQEPRARPTKLETNR